MSREVWFRNGDPDDRYVLEDGTGHIERVTWVQPWEPEALGNAPEAAETAQDGPQQPAAVSEPTPLPLTHAGRLRALIEAVRRGDKSAVGALREAIGGDPDDAA